VATPSSSAWQLAQAPALPPIQVGGVINILGLVVLVV